MSVLELAPVGSGEVSFDGPESVRVMWQLERPTLPEQLCALFDTSFSCLSVALGATVHRGKKKWEEHRPFNVTLEVVAFNDGTEILQKQVASLNLPIGYMWSAQSRKALTLSTVRPSGIDNYQQLCDELVESALAAILKEARATIRWDDKGLVVVANFAATYISTREHSS